MKKKITYKNLIWALLSLLLAWNILNVIMQTNVTEQISLLLIVSIIIILCLHKQQFDMEEYDNSNINLIFNEINPTGQLIEEKKKFIEILKHDLKTPVIAQIRSLEMLLGGKFGKVSESQKEILELTVNSCENIYQMISTILYSYKLESNETHLNNIEVNFNELVLECCEHVEASAREKDIKIVVKPKNKKNIICADIIYLKPAIIYLIENSISFAYRSSTIEIKIENDNKNIIFEIMTKSPYLEQQTFRHMISKYVGTLSSYNKIGFCIKLNFCKEVIKAHKGQIIAKRGENAVGFKLPYAFINPAKV